jgi:hypothetical protein
LTPDILTAWKNNPDLPGGDAMSQVFLYDKRLWDHSLIDSFSNFLFTTLPIDGCNVLLRWGNIRGSDNNAKLVLNRKIPLTSCLDKEKMFYILKLNRIKRPRLVVPKPDSRYPLIAKFSDPSLGVQKEEIVTNWEETQNSEAEFFVECINTVNKYNIYLFDMKVFLLTKKLSVKTNSQPGHHAPFWKYEEIPKDLDQDTQKVTLLAQRTQHILGLDFCMVHVGIDVQGRTFILDVSPVPVLPSEAVPRFSKEINKYITKWNAGLQQRQQHFTDTSLGTEPGYTQTAFFTHTPTTRQLPVMLGADPEFMLRSKTTGKIIYPSDFLAKEGSLGYDHRSERREGVLFPLAEVRPEPDLCPLKLTEKIREILVKAAVVLPAHAEWLACSLHFGQYQIGGHIHFSNCEINSLLLRALDNYLAIPIMLAEDPRNSIRRRKQYGWLGSIRTKPHGGFEYRTPGSWLISPEATRSCLCLAKIVATDYLDLPKDYLADPELQKAFYQSKKYYFYDLFNELWQDIKHTPLYHKYATYLSPLVNLIQNRSHWDENTDFRSSWGVL